jgi:tetratricopeptide (TPR) repeat protein
MKLLGLFLILFIVSFNMPGPAHPISGEEEDQGDKQKIVYCGPSFDTSYAKDSKAPLLNGLGGFQYAISTKSPMTQKYFNQGLALTYGFNHGEAARSFRTALSFDSTCGMAWWGLALVLGPNYNAALNPSSLADIREAINNALRYSAAVAPNEKALIRAMAKRFPDSEVEDMSPFYTDYAKAMREAHLQYPLDYDIATLYADALMNLHPWDLWLKDGTAKPWTTEIIQLLEYTLKKDPDHPGAAHYYIHATEASRDPGRALPFADKLGALMPAAGHLVHMPSHVYIRTGDYHKGVLVNEKASLADSTYIAQCRVQGAYPLLYYPHNIHFLAACAFWEGNSKKALEAAWMVSRKSDKKALAQNITVQHFYIIPYYVLVHLGKWEEIFKAEKPQEGLLYPMAIWHYARGMAFGAKGNLAAAQLELDTLKQIAQDPRLEKMMIWDLNTATNLVNIAQFTLQGELLGHQKNYDEAFIWLKKAAAIEDILNYNEPPDWFFSVRHTLGHWQVQADQFSAAEKTYREDLELFKENGWALMGLYNSLKGQGRASEAQLIRKRFDKAWKWADIKINSSRLF